MLRHAMYNLRGGFLIRPLTIALTLGAAGAFLSWLEEEFPAASGLGAHGPVPLARRPASSPKSFWRNRRLHHDGGVHRVRHPAD